MTGIGPVAMQRRPQPKRQFGARYGAVCNVPRVEYGEIRIVGDHIVEYRNEVAVALGGIRRARYEARFLDDGLRTGPPGGLLAGGEVDVRDAVHDEARRTSAGSVEGLVAIGYQQPAVMMRLRRVTVIDPRELAEVVGEPLDFLERVPGGSHVDRSPRQEAHGFDGVERCAADVGEERKHVVLGNGSIEEHPGPVV